MKERELQHAKEVKELWKAHADQANLNNEECKMMTTKISTPKEKQQENITNQQENRKKTTQTPSDNDEVIEDLYSSYSCDDQRTTKDVQWIPSKDAIQETKTNNKEQVAQKVQKARKARTIQKRQGKDIKNSAYKSTPQNEDWNKDWNKECNK